MSYGRPTPEQEQVLQSIARIRVVRAAPGSGKTWLVAESIRRNLEKWEHGTSGIAALSFTRVGGEEIRRAVGYDLGHPHFVGTLDAFLFRYVVRPFTTKVFEGFKPPRLIAADLGANFWKNYALNKSTNIPLGDGKSINLMECVYVGESEGKVLLAHKPHPKSPLVLLPPGEAEVVRQAKGAMFKTFGFMTHSDASYVAHQILRHSRHGPTIRSILTKRFKLIIIDELQDTGYFLGKAFRGLLNEPSCNGLVVGDPDQAIFEFNGARPELFNAYGQLPGAITLELSNSQRCPTRIAAVASKLKDSGGTLGSAEDRPGRAILIRYDDFDVDIPQLLTALKGSGQHGPLKVVARATATVERLAGRRTQEAASLHCRPLYHVQRGVSFFRGGRITTALAAATAALSQVFFQHEGVAEQDLVEYGVEPQEWKKLAASCLLKANAIEPDGSLYEWQEAVGQMLDQELASFAAKRKQLSFTAGRLKPQKRKGWSTPSEKVIGAKAMDGASVHGFPVQTVHSVKGETHHTTIFVCPPFNHGAEVRHCPSVVWWATTDGDSEERRIAYVAMTRASENLIVCMHNSSYEKIARSHPEFLEAFELITAGEFTPQPS